MQYWINHHGVQSGPHELEDLKQMGLTSATHVWRAGMSDWVKITQMPELQGIFTVVDQPAAAAAPQPSEAVTGQPIQPQPASPQYMPQAPAEPCPPTNMVWAILATILCCIPLGIVGIYYANQVSKLYQAGDLEGAKSASETGAWWCIATIILGILSMPLGYLMMIPGS